MTATARPCGWSRNKFGRIQSSRSGIWPATETNFFLRNVSNSSDLPIPRLSGCGRDIAGHAQWKRFGIQYGQLPQQSCTTLPDGDLRVDGTVYQLSQVVLPKNRSEPPWDGRPTAWNWLSIWTCFKWRYQSSLESGSAILGPRPEELLTRCSVWGEIRSSHHVARIWPAWRLGAAQPCNRSWSRRTEELEPDECPLERLGAMLDATESAVRGFNGYYKRMQHISGVLGIVAAADFPCFSEMTVPSPRPQALRTDRNESGAPAKLAAPFGKHRISESWLLVIAACPWANTGDCCRLARAD